LKKGIISLVAAMLLIAAIYFSAQLFWSVELVSGLRREAIQRERGLLYRIDQAALAAELRKFAYDYRWSQTVGTNVQMLESNPPTIFWSDDAAIPLSLRILQPTSIAIFDDRIMFERGGPLHHFGIVVFRQTLAANASNRNITTGEHLLKEFQPGVWFYSDYRKLPGPW
jgi:hypothetical protein